MSELTAFQKELLRLGLPLGTVFSLEFRLGVRDWHELESLSVVDLGQVPGMTRDRIVALQAAARARRPRPSTGDDTDS